MADSGEMYRAGLPMPGARLLAAAGLVRPGVPVADVGCDHSKLAVYLAKSGHSPKVVAVDVRPMPLSRAKAFVRQTGCADVVDCRLGNGLQAVMPGEVQDVIIAGLSGETMVNILTAAPWVQSPQVQLVLVPTTQSSTIRRWLLQNGFALLQEEPVEERGYYYTVLQVGYTGVKIADPPALLCEVGLVCGNQSPAAVGYLNRRLAHLQKKAHANLPPSQQQALQQLISEVQACLM